LGRGLHQYRQDLVEAVAKSNYSVDDFMSILWTKRHYDKMDSFLFDLHMNRQAAIPRVSQDEAVRYFLQNGSVEQLS
jgi:hypothetical protein